MKRKLVQQAGQAITITLPIDWVRKNGLKAGDEVDVASRERELILSTTNKITGRKIKLELTGQPERIMYSYLNSAYAKGIDEIEFTGDYPEITQNMGFAVVSQKKDTYTIKDISGTTTENLDEILKRVFQMIIDFYDNAIDDIFGAQKQTIDALNKKDEEINKFALFLQRAIMKQSYPDPEAGKIMFAYSYALEVISDEILRLWRTNIQTKIKKSEKLKEVLLLSNQSLKKAFEIYYQGLGKINELLELREKTRKKASAMLKTDAAEMAMHAIKIEEDAYDLTHLSLMKKL